MQDNPAFKVKLELVIRQLGGIQDVDLRQKDQSEKARRLTVTFDKLTLTLNAPIATKVVCFSRLLKC